MPIQRGLSQCLSPARWRPAIAPLVVVQSLILALLLSWPGPARFFSEALGTPEGDVTKHVWNLWWARAEWQGGEPGLLTRLVNWPNGMTLYPIEPMSAALAVLLGVAPVALSNALAIGNLWLLGLAAGWLGYVVTKDWRGALTTSALLQGASFVAFTVHVGVGELREVGWLPLGLACLVRAQQTRAWRWFIALGAALAIATLSCFYYGLFLATAVSVHALVTLRRDRGLIRGYAVAAVLALALVAPVIHGFTDAYGASPTAPTPGFFAWMEAAFTVDPFAGASLDLPDLVRSRAGDRAEESRLVYAYTGGRYVGWLAIALAVAGLVAAPRRAAPWGVVAAAGVVLAMGTVVWWGGQILPLSFGLPLLWINRALAWVAEPLNFPARFLSITVTATAVLGGLAVTRWRWLGLAVPLVVWDVAVHDLVPWPRDTTRIPLTADVTAPPGAVADLTVMMAGRGERPTLVTREGAVLPSWIDATIRNRGIAAQILLDRPMQTVAIERQEMWALEGLLWTAALPLSTALVQATHLPHELMASVWLLRDRGFGSVILTHACGGEPPSAAALRLDYVLGPGRRGSCLALWSLPEVSAAEAEQVAWRKAQQLRAAALRPPVLQAARERTVPR